MLKTKKEKTFIDWLCSPNILMGLSLLIILFSLFAPWLFATKSLGIVVFNEQTGHVGDTFGVMNPIIAIAAAIITFAAFYMQWQANEKVNKQENYRQINELSTYHLTLVESIELYDNTRSGNVLRTGSESLHTLFSKMYFFWLFQDILKEIAGKKDFITIELFGTKVEFFAKDIDSVANDWAENRRNMAGLEIDLRKYITKERMSDLSRACLERLIEYYGYLFSHVFSHLFYVFEEIESNPFLNDEEKEKKAVSFAKMIPAFEVVFVFLMIEFNVESFKKENRVDKRFPTLKKYGLFRILDYIDFFMKNEFLENRERYI